MADKTWSETAAPSGITRKARRLAGRLFDHAVWSIDRIFDLRHGTDTGSILALQSLRIESSNVAHGTRYEPSPTSLFKKGMGYLPIKHDEFVFIDLGSGKGRMLLLASHYPFAEVIGVEFARDLHEIAEKNLERYRSRRQRCHKHKSICADVADFELPRANLVIYIANPFDDLILREVLRKIENIGVNWKIYVIYCEAVFSHVVDEAAALPYKKELPLPPVLLRRPGAFSSLVVYSNQKF